MDDPTEPRTFRGEPMMQVTREDLELYGVADLEERIVALQAEIERTRSQLDKKRSGRSAADALFNFGRD
jgi:uncharacterized small protein (DUF1192 family)